MRLFMKTSAPSTLLCLALALAAVLPGCGSGAGDSAAGPLLVAGFENATGNDAFVMWDPWLSDMLIRDLWQSAQPAVWSPEQALALRRRAGDRQREVVLQSAREAGARLVLFGRVSAGGAGFSVTADLVRAEDARAIATLTAAAATPNDLPAAMDSLRDGLWEALGVETPPGLRTVTALTTADLEAYGEFVAGEVLYDQGRYLAALDRFQRAGEKDVDFAQAHYRRATARLQYVVGGDGEAQSFITVAWAKRDRAGERDRLAIEALRDLVFGESAKAAGGYAGLRSKYPGDAELAYFHGVALSRSGDLAGAAAAFSAAVAAAPELLPAREALANAHILQGEPDLARDVARAGLEINPVDPGLLEAEVTADLLTGRFDEAGEVLERSLPGSQDARLQLAQGNLLLLTGQVAAAREHFLGMRSPFSIALADLYAGSVNAALARLTEMSAFQVAAGNSGPAAVGLWFIGMVMAENNNPDLAIEQYTKGFNLAPAFADNLVAVGVLAARKGDLQRASRALAALRSDEGRAAGMDLSHMALLLEGEIARGRGDHDEAVVLLEEALKGARIRFLAGGLISDRPLLTDALARAQVDKGDLDGAARTYRTLTEMAAERLHWPWLWLEAHVRLAELAARAGRTDEAEDWAGVVRRYWGAAAGQQQPLVDGMLQRLERILPAR